ncbi:MAG TPA: isoleucine--tRNA ligase [Candidatus Woesebacteria bacterium]|nr:isoleucine--tRNA ligase [Candidatus Woesebacteria bacterium]HQO51192.1 isoleucine--tRNA ligase [Candidatus Woesebacteria bacterium]
MAKIKITDFKTTPDLAKLEEAILQFWDDEKVFEQSLKQRAGAENFSFYDGPPFATGLPHYGHLMQSMIKDLVPRYQTMRGKYVRRVWGWDCHGLPIENLIEKELDLKDKQAIEDYGIAAFNQACQARVLTYAKDWEKTIKRIGRFIDMKNAYKTMDKAYMESVWWVFSELYQKGLIYQSHKVMYICPRCSTPLSNFEVTQGYKDIKDLAVTAKFKLLDTTDEIYLLAWTTTAWTLPGNMFLAVNPDLDYVLVEEKSTAEKYYLAKSRLEEVFADRDYQIVKTVKGQDLVGLNYQPPFSYFGHLKEDQDLPQAARKLIFTVQAADFVNLEDGTGIVHVAPAFGEDDYQLGESLLNFSNLETAVKNKLFIQHVNFAGRFIEAVTDFAGMEVKPKADPQATDVAIIRYLAKKQLLFAKQQITHSYPHCWRCDTPLLNYATDSWFVKVSSFKDQLLKNNQAVNWQPAHIKDGRFGNWLAEARDWAISRNRYWGTPLPLWQSADGDLLCVSSSAELEKLSGQKVANLHKEFIDDIVIKQNGKVYRHLPEVLDCWFESGAMPYAQFHYPFSNQQLFAKNFPANFIAEGQDQTRGWFYTLHVLATALTMSNDQFSASFDKPPSSAFQNVMCTGLIMASDGKKMSKRLKNYPEPEAIIDQYGADSLRLYLLSSAAVKAETLNFEEKEVADIRRRVFLIWWNILAFYQTFADQQVERLDLQKRQPINHVLDRWLLSRLSSLRQQLVNYLDNYDVMRASRLVAPFINDFSTWYLRLSRERLKAETSQQVSQVFATALAVSAQLFAPIVPFFSELVYQQLQDDDRSIHLSDYPEILADYQDKELETAMNELRQLVELGHAQRKSCQIPLRQPLAAVTFSKPASFKDNAELMAILKQELNVKKVLWGKAQGKDIEVSFDLEITADLAAEGQARQIIRRIQNWRKKAGLKVDQQVPAYLNTWPNQFTKLIEEKTNTQLIRAKIEGLNEQLQD